MTPEGDNFWKRTPSFLWISPQSFLFALYPFGVVNHSHEYAWDWIGVLGALMNHRKGEGWAEGEQGSLRDPNTLLNG